MSNSPTFVQHTVDLLGLVAPVQARAMFGGHGLYAHGVMFALVDDDELFLKADDASRERFAEAGCRQWVYPSAKGPMPASYYRPPDEAHEDPEAMLPWGRLALDAALRAQASKAAKARGKRKGKGGPAKTPTAKRSAAQPRSGRASIRTRPHREAGIRRRPP